MKYLVLLMLAVSLCAQPQDQVCHKWDWHHAHEIQVPCKKALNHGRGHVILRNIGHDAKVTAEVVGAAAIVALVIAAGGGVM